MEYRDLLDGIAYTGTPPKGRAVAVTQDSRKVQPGSVFVCIAGRGYDGHDFAKKALEAGAGMVVSQHPLGLANEVTAADTRAAYAEMCQNFFGRPAEKLTLVGVTGTNGKTTVSTALKQTLENMGVRCGLVGTIQSEVGELVVPAKFTTPEAWDLAALFARMVKAGCSHVIMEASSQALEQGRLHGLRFALAIFTNLTEDHLDYHGDMWQYFEAKKRLFAQSDAALINLDDKWGRRLMDEAESPVKMSFSQSSNMADFSARNVDLRADSVRFALLGDGFLCPVRFGMPGDYSVANALAVASAAVMLGYQPEAVGVALGEAKGVRGRCEVLYGGPFTVIADFAHTADGLEKLLSALKPFVKGRMVVVFGCAGDRDATKRPAMGEAVARYADEIYVTADNPRTEDIMKTINDALPPIEATKVPFAAEPDRERAINQALAGLLEGDMLVLCGKGHEDYQVMDGVSLYLNERQLVNEWLKDSGMV